MTVQEAIEDINENIKPVIGGKSLDMAIEALETIQEMKKRNIGTEIILEYAKFEDECIHKNFTFTSLLEARKKQIPEKPILRRTDEKTRYECLCGAIQMTRYKDGYRMGAKRAYCDRCGQKIDWSSVDD